MHVVVKFSAFHVVVLLSVMLKSLILACHASCHDVSMHTLGRRVGSSCRSLQHRLDRRTRLVAARSPPGGATLASNSETPATQHFTFIYVTMHSPHFINDCAA